MKTETFSFSEMLLEFVEELRKNSVPIGTDNYLTYLQAISHLNPANLVDLYWSGRTTLINRHEWEKVYDRIFKEFFLNEESPEVVERRKKMVNPSNAQGVIDIPDSESDENNGNSSELRLGVEASGAQIMRQKNFRDCTSDELATINKIIKLISFSPPQRLSRRWKSKSKSGKLEFQKLLKYATSHLGELGEINFLKRKLRMRPMVFVLDVSGSMADYSRNLLQLAYAIKRAHGKVEVFCFGTKLTRITHLLDKRDPNLAMELAGQEVFDWDGGTQIGRSLKELLDKWGRSGKTRGSIVTICSDGLDRGSPDLLENSIKTLSRLSHRIVWVNPNFNEKSEFNTMALMIAKPFIDFTFSGANLKSIEDFARFLSNQRH